MIQYEFEKGDAYRFADFINAKVSKKGTELVFFRCPYCGGGKNHDRKTFAINLNSGAFNCQRTSCGMAGNMITLARDFKFELSDDVTRYLDQSKYSGKHFRRFKSDHEIKVTDKAIAFLESRGISKEVCEKYEITSKDGNRIVFPFKDENNKLTFIKYRNTDQEQIDKYGKEFCERNCKPILFGMNHCNPENKTLVITEGQIDSLSLTEADIENAVSVPTGARGFTWVPYCVDWMENFDEIIVFGDYENGEITLLEEITRRFHRSKRIKHVDERDYLECKDANEILQKHGIFQLQKCIMNAVAMPVDYIKDFADIEYKDPDEIERVETGIHALDYILDGGIPMGLVTLINGRTGEGKSTLANQMAVYARENDKKVMIYSGELSASFLKSQIMLQVAGPDFVERYENKYGKERARVSSSVVEKINDWMRDYFYVYDSTSTSDGNEREELIKVIENAIQQYGINYIVVDNLMTAIDLEPSAETSKYDRQGEFTNKLARIALEFEVAIVLIAHRRKSNNNQQNDNDEVLGSSQITNLVGYNIFYGKKTENEIQKEINSEIEDRGLEKAKDEESKQEIKAIAARIREKAEKCRVIRVTKNRVTGECNMQGFVVEFEPASKRIYRNTQHNSVDQMLSWAKADIDNGFIPVGDLEIPFDV